MDDSPKPDEELSEIVDDERTKFTRLYEKVLKWDPPKNDYEVNENSFDTDFAWEALLSLPSCQEIMINESNQKLLNLVVGVNVTQEFPWKQLPFKILQDLFDEIPNGSSLRNAFQDCDIESHVLIGYAPLITQDMDEPSAEDPFVLYIDPADAKLALEIIRNLETFERLLVDKRLSKQPRKWVSLGSENEVDLTMAHRYHESVDVEIEGVYPLTVQDKQVLGFRLTSDVRDGYVELIPSEGAQFENVSRRRISVGIQSSFPRVNIDQQTDPTFPTNAWSQYLYEIDEEEYFLNRDSGEEEGKDESASKSNQVIEVSDNVKFLLKTLEFNQIDMYRDDYPYISDKYVQHYTSPYLEEILCFANIAKTHNRYMCGYDWYPALAGLIVTSYTFSTAATTEIGNSRHDIIQRNVLDQKPILMWSLSDNLNYKLEFESNLEVITLSFCPYEANILLGGATNGQIILWDLQSRAENLDVSEVLSAIQISYRVIMDEFFKWTITVNEDVLVPSATVSDLESSQKGTITSIQWMGSNCCINTFGKVTTVPNGSTTYRYFMTSSLDGTIAFWDLDTQTSRKTTASSRGHLPRVLTQNESEYKGKTLKPIFTVAFNEPITATIADISIFRSEKDTNAPKRLCNYAIKAEEVFMPEVRQSFIISSFYGHIERLTWLGLYDETSRREDVTAAESFARVHDGPITAMKRNPFLPWLFVSIGRTIFAVWKDDYSFSPIFWRKRKCDLTAVAWSESRPSVLFLTRIDGGVEAWDILSRKDDAILNDTLGGGIVTTICEQRTLEPEKLLGIGDYNSSLRMVKLPRSLHVAMNHEVEDIKEYILKEESRKKEIQAFELKYNEQHKEFIESKLQAERDAHIEMERSEREAILKAHRKAKEEEEAKKAAEPTKRTTYTEHMKKQWHELNLKRLLDILMSRNRVNQKQLNEQTVLEKERLAYELAKKQSVAQVLKEMAAEVAAVRMHILPQEIPDLQRKDMIQLSVEKIMQNAESYYSIETEANAAIKDFDGIDYIDYAEFLHRGQQRRKLLNKSLGGNTERWYWYTNMVEDNLISDCDWGVASFAELFQTSEDLPLSSELTLVTNKELHGRQAEED